MQRLFSFLFKYAPQLLISLGLVIAQLVFIDRNIIGVYLFGSLFTGTDRYKIVVISVFITLLYDSIKIIPLGTWALSFFAIVFMFESILQLFQIRDELRIYTLRGVLLLTIIISSTTVLQSYAIQLLSTHTLVKGGEFSIVILTLLFILLRKISATRSSREYIQL